MTAETDLLPLPDADGELVIHMAGRPVEIDAFRPSTLRAYARANVAHATVAKDAEIEALRAEVAEWKRVASAQAELHGESEARAERLAEALRGMMDEYEALHAEYDLGDCQATVDARAALHPTAAQEGDHD